MSAPPSSTSQTDQGQVAVLDLRFDDPLTDAATVHRIRSGGSGSYDISVVASGGGGLVTQPGRKRGVDRALRFPPFAPVVAGPRALIRVVPGAGSSDDLNPGSGDFVFGADVRLDADSQAPGSTDDGNNVVQRGLYADPTQYKLEIDEGVASCRVKGSSGDVQVSSTSPLGPGRWYRLRCARTADGLSLTVSGWASNGVATTAEVAEHGQTGDLTPPSQTLPLTIGAKLGSDGETIEPASDQFNGLIDNVLLRIG